MTTEDCQKLMDIHLELSEFKTNGILGYSVVEGH